MIGPLVECHNCHHRWRGRVERPKQCTKCKTKLRDEDIEWGRRESTVDSGDENLGEEESGRKCHTRDSARYRETRLSRRRKCSVCSRMIETRHCVKLKPWSGRPRLSTAICRDCNWAQHEKQCEVGDVWGPLPETPNVMGPSKVLVAEIERRKAAVKSARPISQTYTAHMFGIHDEPAPPTVHRVHGVRVDWLEDI